jgi:plastocyanin
MSTVRGVAMAALAAAVMSGCSDDETVTDPGPPPSQIQVSMRDNFFQQRVDTVAINGTVTWRNDGVVAHTSTSDAGTWDSGSVNSGATFARQFTQAGTFPYHCTFHGAPGTGMSGTIVVR